jgi:cytochrome P450
MVTTDPACPVDDGFGPLAPDYLRDPFAVLAGIPVDETPIFYAPSIGYYVLTRWADIEEVFRDPGTYSAAAAQLPLVLVPPADHDRVKRWCGYRALLGWGRPAPEEQVEIATEMAEYRRYLRDLVRDKQEHPGDDIASDLLAIHKENPDQITLEEIASILFSLSFAGHETSTYLIGNTVRRLLEDPARWTALVEDRSLIPHAVEEVLRFDTSVPVWRRITTRPVRLGGVDLPEGAKLFCWLAAAGRDPVRFPEPERFDLHRENAADHLAFGKGIHYCLGAGLARTEVSIILKELLDRYPRLRLVEGQELTFHPNISFRGPQKLWLEHD